MEKELDRNVMHTYDVNNKTTETGDAVHNDKEAQRHVGVWELGGKVLHS
jgi:hypothetical protein